ncbi:acetate/propionate family kinase [Phaeobacter sp. B1627]|uniref:acetate/propionate family kinase n=1 Tax=Phaeobacter sp. B1627 TaxID=2583809 RepID=UPI00111A91A3|nr:acetate/propionate family kinase [Phaeobacter sp. B1627]TNJ43312.1 acetate/propionate family kinase [Phaeobacter sp. B1627]
MKGVFLILNAGSSSLKFAVHEAGSPVTPPLLRGKISGLGTTPVFSAQDNSGADIDPGALAALEPDSNHETLIADLLPWLASRIRGQPLVAVGHRVVHGGQHFDAPVLISPEVLRQLDTFVPLAPLHQPHNLAAIRAVAKWQPAIPQIACFDTSFHRSQNRLAELFALPRDLTNAGVVRYGFHGLSYEYIASILPDHLGERASGRMIVAHLGNGSSICALKDRKSAATSMGFTALDGLMMGCRCGTLDPGVILYLMQAKGMTAPVIEALLYTQSGLLGVSGISNDMHVLQDSDSPHAKEAIDLYCYRAACGLAGLLPSIGGLDGIVFTAGIGENSALVRRLICGHLSWLGISLNDDANDRNATAIGSTQSKVPVLVLPTNEEVIVARACHALLPDGRAQRPQEQYENTAQIDTGQ